MTIYQKIYKQNHLAQGLCINCAKKAEIIDGKVTKFCKKHRLKYNLYQKKRYKIKIKKEEDRDVKEYISH